jgi:hypothetical protein
MLLVLLMDMAVFVIFLPLSKLFHHTGWYIIKHRVLRSGMICFCSCNYE